MQNAILYQIIYRVYTNMTSDLLLHSKQASFLVYYINAFPFLQPFILSLSYLHSS